MKSNDGTGHVLSLHGKKEVSLNSDVPLISGFLGTVRTTNQ
jgi:hypothetical protein